MQILKHNFYIILKTQLLIGKILTRSILLALYGWDFGKEALIKKLGSREHEQRQPCTAQRTDSKKKKCRIRIQHPQLERERYGGPFLPKRNARLRSRGRSILSHWKWRTQRLTHETPPSSLQNALPQTPKISSRPQTNGIYSTTQHTTPHN